MVVVQFEGQLQVFDSLGRILLVVPVLGQGPLSSCGSMLRNLPSLQIHGLVFVDVAQYAIKLGRGFVSYELLGEFLGLVEMVGSEVALDALLEHVEPLVDLAGRHDHAHVEVLVDYYGLELDVRREVQREDVLLSVVGVVSALVPVVADLVQL